MVLYVKLFSRTKPGGVNLHAISDFKMTTSDECRPDPPSPTNQRNVAGAAQVSTEDSRYPGKTLEDDNSIRLIEILPGNDDEPVRCALFNVRLEDSTRPEYEALSYYWGDPKSRREIEIYESFEVLDGENTCFLVPENCFSALRRLRRRARHGTADDNPIFWIDSICIDQSCISERNHQLSLMFSIYSNASRVVIDLGPEADESADFMDWIADLHAPSDHAAQAVKPGREIIQKFFARPWFRRVWVLQEALLAREVAVICGDRQVPWEALRTFKDYDQGKIVWSVPYVLRNRPSQWVRDTEMDESKISRRLFNCLRDSRGCEATDPRDQVYALLPLLVGDMQGNHKGLVKADYSRTTSQVYTELACKFLNTSGIGLGVIQAVFPSSNIPGLPSWVPDWSMKPCFSYMLYDHMSSAIDDTFLEEESDLVNTMSNRGQHIWHVDPAMGGLFVSIDFLGSVTHLTNPAIISLNDLPLSQWKTVLPQWSLVRSDDASQPRRLTVKPGLKDFYLYDVLDRCQLSPFTRILVKDRVIYADALQRAERWIMSFERKRQRRLNMESNTSGPNVTQEKIVHPTQWHTYKTEVLSRDEGKERDRASLTGLFSTSKGSDNLIGVNIMDSCDGRRVAVIGGEWLALVPMETKATDWIGFIHGVKPSMVMRYAEEDRENEEYRKARLVGECFILDVAGKGLVTRSAAMTSLEKIVII